MKAVVRQLVTAGQRAWTSQRWLILAIAFWSGAVVPSHAFPVISQFTPTSGAPGTFVKISGSGLVGISSIQFNTALVTDFTTNSPSLITVRVPPDATTGPITITTSTGLAVSAQSFVVSPRLTGFSPAFGAPGDIILVNGANFVVGATTVKFNGVTAVATVTAETQLQASVPVGASTGPISVSTVAGSATSATNFTVLGPGPFITGFDPAVGQAGDQVVITGVKFTGAISVAFDDVPAKFSVVADTQILATVPVGATTGPIGVATPLGGDFSDTHFVVTNGPVITSFDPTQGPVGSVIAIFGRNFTPPVGVAFGGVRATINLPADTEILATVPPGAVTGPLTISNAFGRVTSTQIFTVTFGPTVTNFQPASAPVGAQVIVFGSHFTGATAVKFGGVAATKFSVNADTQIEAFVPAGATNGPISVTTAQGTGQSTNVFIVLPPGPVITGFSPPGGAAGQAVRIDGNYFTGATGVLFNGSNAVFQVTADTQIQTTVPPSATTGPIAVVTPAGTNTTQTNFFVRASIQSFTPTSGAPGTVVTLRGGNFTGATSVAFNNTNASFIIDSPTQIRATVPLTASSGPLTITSPGGTVISANDFVVTVSITGFRPLAGPPGTVVEIAGTSFTSPAAVYFGNNVPANNQVVSPILIRATVPAGAITGPISVRTSGAQATSAGVFTVAISADLGLTLANDFGPALVGNSLSYTLFVTNHGPSDATAVIVTNTLPAGVTVLSAGSSQGTNVVSGGTVVFGLGPLPALSNAVCTLTILTPQAGLITNRAVVRANEPDPVLTNNLVALTTLVNDLMDVNLVRNGDAEAGLGGSAIGDLEAVPGWYATSNFTVLQYGLGGGLPSPTSPGPADRGVNFFAGGLSNTVSLASQKINVGAAPSLIDASLAAYTLSGYLGGVTDHGDNATFLAHFLAANGVALGQAAIGPVSAADRTNTTSLLYRAVTGVLPPGTRQIAFDLQMVHAIGVTNEAVADNLSFVLTPVPLTAVIALTLAPGRVNIRWPASASNFVVEATSALPTASWVPLTNSVFILGNWRVVEDAIRSSNRFYRLHAP